MFRDGLALPAVPGGDPPDTEFISVSKKQFNTIHANNDEFYEELADVIEREPLDVPDPELAA